ncbi:hypothetical protein DRB96_06005 [Streptomyces sp. ICC1]|nr:hypothetical protein DRB89_14680 [Streptomyces sp. ICC4]AWZ11941.1 hypothetical protein DRB96_06005 [Streptomyces sp. ICC1]
MNPDPQHKKSEQSEDGQKDEHKKKCSTGRDISTAAPDYVGFPVGTIFRVATDREGHAFLNDSRNPGVWINLGTLANAPKCVTDTAVSVTEGNPGYLYVSLLAKDGVVHQARCGTSSTPFTPVNLPTVCGTGFAAVQDTPV